MYQYNSINCVSDNNNMEICNTIPENGKLSVFTRVLHNERPAHNYIIIV